MLSFLLPELFASFHLNRLLFFLLVWKANFCSWYLSCLRNMNDLSDIGCFVNSNRTLLILDIQTSERISYIFFLFKVCFALRLLSFLFAIPTWFVFRFILLRFFAFGLVMFNLIICYYFFVEISFKCNSVLVLAFMINLMNFCLIITATEINTSKNICLLTKGISFILNCLTGYRN